MDFTCVTKFIKTWVMKGGSWLMIMIVCWVDLEIIFGLSLRFMCWFGLQLLIKMVYQRIVYEFGLLAELTGLTA